MDDELRSRARRLAPVPAAVVALAVSAALAACARRETPPSLVMILVDTLRQDHLAAYGYARETAPTLSRLAAEGAVLDGLSVTSWTKPAVASLFTGLHPLRHQVIAGEALTPEARTLAERLQSRGYGTLAVSGNAQVSRPFGLGQGFDEMVLVPGRFPPAEAVNREVLARLSSLREPFFLYVHYVDPHAPYDPDRGWDGSALAPRLRDRRPLGDDVLEPRRFGGRPSALVRDALDLYDGEIRRADRAIGELLAALRGRGLPPSTVTVLLSDHGEEFEEHGRTGHAQSLYAEVVRVPLIVHAPGRVAAGVRHGRASLLDVLPTVSTLLGDPGPAGDVDGVDLAGFLRSGRPYDDPRREHLLHLDVPGSASLALVTGGRKLLLSRTPHRKEIFDLAADPGDRDDLWGRPGSGEAVADLARRLADRHNELADQALPPAPDAASAELREALAAVGYLSPPGAQPRAIPRRIVPVDRADDGLLGWEDAARATPCLRTGAPEAAGLLLEGWHAVELGGRWTGPSAAALLARPSPGPLRLVVEGVNHEFADVRFDLAAGDQAPVGRCVPHGPFRVSADVPPEGPARLVVRLTRPTPFVPAQRGLHDDRTLGVFVVSMCLRPR